MGKVLTIAVKYFFREFFFRKICTETYLSRPCDIKMARIKRFDEKVTYGNCRVPFLYGKPLAKSTFFQILYQKKKKKNAQVDGEPQKSGLRFHLKHLPGVWILWIFGFHQKKEKSVFGFRSPDLDFPIKTHPLR